MSFYTFKRSLAVMTVLGLGLSGCGTSIKLSAYKPTTLPKAKNMPSKEVMMSNELPKVIIMDIDDNGMKIAKQAQLGRSIATDINTNLAQARSVKLVKRVNKVSYDKMLSKEVKAAELSKELGTDVGQADYILTGQLSNASYDHSFHEGYYYYVKTKRGKERRYHPPYISYKACAVGNIKIFALPSLKEASSIPFNECSSKSEDARSASEAKLKNNGLVRAAGNEAADTVKYPLKNFFAKKGYISEMRKDGDDLIVNTTLGTKFGAKEGEEVKIYAIEDLTNSLTGVTKKTEVQIGTGKISNQINSDFSWIIVDEVEDGKNIEAGDYIKINYQEGLFSKAMKWIK
jgi:TolB-like protein